MELPASRPAISMKNSLNTINNVKSNKSNRSSNEFHSFASKVSADRSVRILEGKYSDDIQSIESVSYDCNCIVNSSCLQVVITATVLLNILQMGLEADYPEFQAAWVIGENIAVAIFLIEMILKIIAWRMRYFCDRANWVDGFLAILGVIDCWILPALPDSPEDLRSLSLLRIMRLLRMARIAKIAKNVKQIVLVVSGLYNALATTFWVFVVLVCVMFVFAIFCTQYIGHAARDAQGDDLYPGYSRDEDVIDAQEIIMNFNPYLAFGNMPASMLTLFNIAIGSEWSEIVRPLAYKQPYFVFLFLSYCIVIVFGVMNVIIGIVVDNVMEESKKLDMERDSVVKSRKRALLRRIQEILSIVTLNDDGKITYKGLQHTLYEGSELSNLLNECDFPAGWSARELLAMLDTNGDGALQGSEFTMNVFRLIDGDNFQQSCTLQAGINQVKYMVRQSHIRLERQIKDLKDLVYRPRLLQESSHSEPSLISEPTVYDSPKGASQRCTMGDWLQMTAAESMTSFGPLDTGMSQQLAPLKGRSSPPPRRSQRRKAGLAPDAKSANFESGQRPHQDRTMAEMHEAADKEFSKCGRSSRISRSSDEDQFPLRASLSSDAIAISQVSTDAYLDVSSPREDEDPRQQDSASDASSEGRGGVGVSKRESTGSALTSYEEQEEREVLAKSPSGASATSRRHVRRASYEDVVPQDRKSALDIAGFQELQADMTCFVDILESGVLAMRETVYRQLAVLAHGNESALRSAGDMPLQVSRVQSGTINDSGQEGLSVVHEEPEGCRQIAQPSEGETVRTGYPRFPTWL